MWRAIADDLRHRIESGELAPGSMLRAEVDLAADYDVGQRVIRQALRHLAADAVLYLRAGYRALVRHREPVEVRLRRGSRLFARRPKTEEQRDMQLNASALVFEVCYGDNDPEIYEALSTTFTAS
jgi:DNA-binding GntR family transcriptional regulator